MKLVHWPLMGGLLHLVNWYSEKGTGRSPSPPRPLLAVPTNGQCTNHRIAV